MENKCPGQDTRNRSPSNIICPVCSYLAEIFSDEAKVKCPGCKNMIYRERLPSCAQHCKAARECVGEKRWNELKGENNPVSRHSPNIYDIFG